MPDIVLTNQNASLPKNVYISNTEHSLVRGQQSNLGKFELKNE